MAVSWYPARHARTGSHSALGPPGLVGSRVLSAEIRTPHSGGTCEAASICELAAGGLISGIGGFSVALAFAADGVGATGVETWAGFALNKTYANARAASRSTAAAGIRIF